MNALADRVLRSFSLVVTDRRWAAPLSAMALGFGLFVGVAVGPNAAGTLAGPPLIVELPAPADEPTEVETGGGEGPVLVGPGPIGGGGGGGGAPIAAIPPPAPPPEAAPPPKKEPAPGAGKEEAEEAPGEEAIPLEGVVVHSNPAAGSYAIAIEGGELISVHAAKLPAPGAKLKLSAARLDNGTFEEAEKPKAIGQATSASLRGIVTYVDPNPAAPAYTVSGRGSSILVRVRPEPSGAPPALPAVNSYATVEVGIEQPTATSVLQPLPAVAPTCVPEPGQPPLKSIAPAADLWQEAIETEAQPATYLDLAGIVAALCPSTGQVLLSADDTRTSSGDLVLTVGPKIDASTLNLGESLLATATVEPDGSLSLAGVASDTRVKGADDPKAAQGDLKR